MTVVLSIVFFLAIVFLIVRPIYQVVIARREEDEVAQKYQDAQSEILSNLDMMEMQELTPDQRAALRLLVKRPQLLQRMRTHPVAFGELTSVLLTLPTLPSESTDDQTDPTPRESTGHSEATKKERAR